MKNPFYRKPDQTITQAGVPYLKRWFIIRNRFFNIYLHKFVNDDDDRALHDHPWPSLSIILKGSYVEYKQVQLIDYQTKQPVISHREIFYPRWSFIFRPAEHTHRIVLFKRKRKIYIHQGNINPVPDAHVFSEEPIPVWTLFITGRKIREWGFHCPNGWRHWTKFVDPNDHGAVGKGCE